MGAEHRSLRQRLRDAVSQDIRFLRRSEKIDKNTIVAVPDIGFQLDNTQFPEQVKRPDVLSVYRSLLEDGNVPSDENPRVLRLMGMLALNHVRLNSINKSNSAGFMGIGMGGLSAFEAGGLIRLKDAAKLGRVMENGVLEVRSKHAGERLVFLAGEDTVNYQQQGSDQSSVASEIAVEYGLRCVYASRKQAEYISDHRDLQDAADELQSSGIGKFTAVLKPEVARRTPYMEQVRKEISECVETIEFSQPSHPIYSEHGKLLASKDYLDVQAVLDTVCGWLSTPYNEQERIDNLPLYGVTRVIDVNSIQLPEWSASTSHLSVRRVAAGAAILGVIGAGLALRRARRRRREQ